MNKIILIGRLTKDVEIMYTQGNEPLAIGKFAIAVNRKGKKDETDFINCVSFGKTAENINKFFGKGSKIALTGRLQINSWEDNNGQKRYSTDVIVEEFEFCESKKETETQPNNGFAVEEDVIGDDLPF